uniref:Uncharacterized protein n=1 Tax=Oryza sativa subsp. japonica TaxID=39947 RepID=Q6H5N6_ORYSJ|nr:hypothetical protein [Oryza sativa Japonica Group]
MSERNDGEGGPASWCARVVTPVEQLLLRRLGDATEGGTKPCHGVGGMVEGCSRTTHAQGTQCDCEEVKVRRCHFPENSGELWDFKCAT